MTCPRCGEVSDRPGMPEFTYKHGAIAGDACICTRCLTDWMIRAADDRLFIIGPHESIKAKGGAM